MNNWYQNGNEYCLMPVATSPLDRLPAGTYVVCARPMSNTLYLEKVDDMKVPSKIYGKINKMGLRIFSTFMDRDHSTGVLLYGTKGCGKTLLAKWLAEEAIGRDMPVLLVTKPFAGQDFSTLLQSLGGPAVVIFDEFEKVYGGGIGLDTVTNEDSKSSQQDLLTLLDGTFDTKHLYVLTCNNEYRVDSHMRNRPGRLYYSIPFNGISDDEIREICHDRLDNQDHLESCVLALSVVERVSYDMVLALIEEMNRYEEDAFEAIQYMNIQPEVYAHSKFVWTATNQDGTPAGSGRSNHPLSGCQIFLSDDYYTVSPQDLISYNPATRTYVAKIKDYVINFSYEEDTKLNQGQLAQMIIDLSKDVVKEDGNGN